MKSRTALHCLALVPLVLLGGCNTGEITEAELGLIASPASEPAGDDGPVVEKAITPENATLLAHSSLEMVGKVAVVGNIATTMLRDHADLLAGSHLDTRNIGRCAGSPDGFTFETNQVSYRQLGDGYYLPGGPSLHVALSNCTIEGVLVSGFIDITAIRLLGDPARDGTWTAEAVLSLGPVEIYHDNGTVTTLTDRVAYAARASSSALETTLTIAADEEAGMIGGVNSQHYNGPLTDATPTVNYQLRPFRIRTLDDAHTAQYTLAVLAGPEGPSRLNRYTSSPATEVIMEVETTAGTPFRWEGGRPDEYIEEPVSGEVRLTAECDDCGSLLATVEDGDVVLAIDAGSSVTTEIRDWDALLATPEVP